MAVAARIYNKTNRLAIRFGRFTQDVTQRNGWNMHLKWVREHLAYIVGFVGAHKPHETLEHVI